MKQLHTSSCVGTREVSQIHCASINVSNVQCKANNTIDA